MSMDMRGLLNPVVRDIPPSGIRRFFDIAGEMEDAISLGVGEPDFVTPCTSATRGFIPWKRARPITLQIPA